jgi:Cdc6-like AAA superfamily ATPase
LPELKQVCDAVEAVLRNQLPASAVKHIAVLGSPGMGKSLLVSQAVLKMQKEFADEQREVYFLKLRGRGAVSMEEDLMTYARSLGSKIAVAADTAAGVALTNLRNYLAHLRFVAIIDDADADGLQAAAKWIPVSSALHMILVTQPSGELTAMESAYGAFTRIELSKFDPSTSVALLQKICEKCSAMKDETQRFQSIAERLDHLPLGVRLFGEWSQARYQREVAAMTKAMKASSKAAETEALQSGLPFDPALANHKFRSEYLPPQALVIMI